MLEFFFDAGMSPRIAEMCAIHGAKGIDKIVHHDQRFEPGTPDVDWLRALGLDVPKSVVISADAAILRRRSEKAALRESGLTFFGMAGRWAQMAFDDQVWMFFRVWPEIVAGANISPPKQFEVKFGRSDRAPEIILVGASPG